MDLDDPVLGTPGAAVPGREEPCPERGDRGPPLERLAVQQQELRLGREQRAQCLTVARGERPIEDGQRGADLVLGFTSGCIVP